MAGSTDLPDHRKFAAVVFDFGGVLITSISNQLGALAASHDVSLDTMLEVMLGPRTSGPDHPWHLAERGQIPVSEIQGRLGPYADTAGISLRGDEMEHLMTPGAYSVVDVMTGRIAQLRDDGYRTGLLTNTFAEFQPTMQRDIDFDLFDVVVESFAVGSRKPERAIYLTMQERLAVVPESIIYLDDFDQNLTEPATLGWTTIHVGDHHGALAELDRLLTASDDATISPAGQ